MKQPLWKFTDDKGSFRSESANLIPTLYFPLCNASPFMSSVTPDLHGDIKTSNNSFLLQPVSRIDLTNLKSSRNFWIYINPRKIWSCSGVSRDLQTNRHDTFCLEAGLLWQKAVRQNKRIGLKAEITSFVPASGEPVEIMRVKLTNISAQSVQFTPTAAIPIFCRSADNLRDHRQVTSLLMRSETQRYGVVVTPTLSFDETGHRKNTTTYFVFGMDENSSGPEHIFPTQEEFCGEASDLQAPTAVYRNLLPQKNYPSQGKEPMGALRFRTKTLPPHRSCSYNVLMGIVKNKKEIPKIVNRFNNTEKIEKKLEATRNYWVRKSLEISVHSKNPGFDTWLRWVSIQPALRKIYGCSFLPDFDYGRGGRGWRDLWQDCLSLLLTSPEEVRPLLIDNFCGVRIDGSNATIIGQKPGEFIADRNNISRVWMDHGIWPWITTSLYIHQTGDVKILLEQATYFRDRQLNRSKTIDQTWSPETAHTLKTKNNAFYRGTLLEHILVQHLVQFFNVGPHNHICLEGADWNDGLDMAAQNGESVAFTAMYAKNLNAIAEALEKLGQKEIIVFKELAIVLDSLAEQPVDYNSAEEKRELLERYYSAVPGVVSGRRLAIPSEKVIDDLRRKAQWIAQHIQKSEWLKEGFFNGYYNNDRQRVEGKINGAVRMTLTAQALPIMSGIATEEQIKIIFRNVERYLKDKKFGGFRLNTDFKEEQRNLGRAFSFIYGDKENGAVFSHMAVMFAYGLYSRGFAREGYAVLNSLYEMASDSETSKIYPCLPEYFNAEGRGMYSYLTGSASWFMLTLLTQAFGIRGEYGDLVIEPKLLAGQFKTQDTISVSAHFARRRLTVSFKNPAKKDLGSYRVQKVTLNGKIIAQNLSQARLVISRKDFLSLANRKNNLIVFLGTPFEPKQGHSLSQS